MILSIAIYLLHTQEDVLRDLAEIFIIVLMIRLTFITMNGINNIQPFPDTALYPLPKDFTSNNLLSCPAISVAAG